MADSNRLTEALKELADALPRGQNESETLITILTPSEAFERIATELHAERQLSGYELFRIRCGHCEYTVQCDVSPSPLVDLR